MQRPETSLAGLVRRSRDFAKTVVEGKRMPGQHRIRIRYTLIFLDFCLLAPDGILPPLLVLPIEREKVHDELVDLRQSQHFRGRVLDGHRDERYVTVKGGNISVTVAGKISRFLAHSAFRHSVSLGSDRRRRRRRPPLLRPDRQPLTGPTEIFLIDSHRSHNSNKHVRKRLLR